MRMLRTADSRGKKKTKAYLVGAKRAARSPPSLCLSHLYRSGALQKTFQNLSGIRASRSPPVPLLDAQTMSVGESSGADAVAAEDGCGRGDNAARLRWAVNVAKWHPLGDHEGSEFQFLLTLLPPNERADCLKMVFMPDKKRALASRLLQRAACARVTNIPHADLLIERTKGRKPFLAACANFHPNSNLTDPSSVSQAFEAWLYTVKNLYPKP